SGFGAWELFVSYRPKIGRRAIGKPAKDGGRKAVAEKNKQRKAMTKTLSKQGRYVDEVANHAITIVIASGFQPNTGPAAPAQETPKAGIDKLVQVNSGGIVVTPESVGA